MRRSYDAEAFKRNFERHFTWLNGFMRNVSLRGDKAALICPQTDCVWTYSDLNREANRLAHALRGSGVGRQDVVLCVLPNAAEFIFAYLAAHKLACVMAPANYRLSGGELALLMDANEPKVILYAAAFSDTVRDALARTACRPQAVVATSARDLQSPPPGGVTGYDAYVEGMPLADPVNDFVPSNCDETVRFFTSGTTNLPKGVPVNSLNEVLSAHDVCMQFPLSADDVTMNLTPWFHRGGLHSGGPCPVLYSGGTMVMLRDFVPRRALRLVERHRITYVIGVPTSIDVLCRIQKQTPADLSSLKGLVLNGSPLDPGPCAKYMRTLTPRVFNGYGTTETYCNTFLRPSDLPERAGSAGRACFDDDVRVVRVGPGFSSPEDMVSRDGREEGEVIIRATGKSTCTYAGNPELTGRKFHDGWMYTGDMATWDAGGYVTVLGRRDDMFLSSGENIYPAQIEAILNKHPDVEESLVLGLPDAVRGSVITAFIKKRSGASLTEDDLKRYAWSEAMLSAYKRPRRYHFVESLDHTAAGKLIHRWPSGIARG